MIYSLLLFSMALFVCILTYFIVIGKIKIIRSLTVYVAITFLPIVLIGFPLVFLYSFIDEYGKYFTFIPIGIIGLELIILLIFIIIKVNVSPNTTSDKNENMDEKLISINGARRLLHYSIFAVFLYSIPILITTILSIFWGLSAIGSIIASIIMLPTCAFLATIPFAMMSFITCALAIGLTVLIITFSINGAVRLSYVSNTVRKNIIKHIIFMLFPIFNIVCMFHLCSLAKKELNIEQ